MLSEECFVLFKLESDQTHYWGKLDSKSETISVLVNSPFESNFKNIQQTSKSLKLKDVQILPPALPTKIIGIGLNYKDHAIEQNKPLPEVPLVFLKALSSLVPTNQTILINEHCSLVHHEAELAVIISKTCKNITAKDADQYIAGFTIANDVTDRPIQKKEATFARAKGMDTFCPLGPFLIRNIDYRNRSIQTWVNGELRQNGNTNEMIFSVEECISFVSQFMTLHPGDVLLTGTPAGVGEIKVGDKVKICIEGLGILTNAVESDCG